MMNMVIINVFSTSYVASTVMFYIHLFSLNYHNQLRMQVPLATPPLRNESAGDEFSSQAPY